MCFRRLKESKLSSWSHLSSRWLAALCAEEYNGSWDSGQKTHSDVTPSATNAEIRFGPATPKRITAFVALGVTSECVFCPLSQLPLYSSAHSAANHRDERCDHELKFGSFSHRKHIKNVDFLPPGLLAPHH